jgi:hypothetical protein
MRLPIGTLAFCPLKPGWSTGTVGTIISYSTHPVHGERALARSTDGRTFWFNVEHMEAYKPVLA